MLVHDPLAALTAGFWLSFAGVAWLMFCLGGESGVPRLLPTFGRTRRANLALLEANALLAGQIAVALASGVKGAGYDGRAEGSVAPPRKVLACRRWVLSEV